MSNTLHAALFLPPMLQSNVAEVENILTVNSLFLFSKSPDYFFETKMVFDKDT